MKLTPRQQESYDGLVRAMQYADILICSGDTGAGRTTVLQQLQAATGAGTVKLGEFIDLLREAHPLSLEEQFERLVSEALSYNNCVIIDDFHLLNNVVCPCGHLNMYPRQDLLHIPLTILAARAVSEGKKLIFGTTGTAPRAIHQRGYYFPIQEFEAKDYAALGEAYLGSEAGKIDYAKVHRFAPNLNCHQLKGAFVWMAQGRADTEVLIEYLRRNIMMSNVDLGEVQAVDLHDLIGMDDVLKALEANVILPLENHELAAELNVSPKRGVLLAGPPGTGKTTIGRALAHRLKGKFFLIDGTVISGTQEFYQRIPQIFTAAEQNAPSVIFIDDSDVIFENGEEMGLYRFLLTMMDGLESRSAARVCVVMTAMNVGSMPPALVRSGRIELWLETSMPDAAARESILRKNLGSVPPALADLDITRIAGATEDLTGADLKRLVEDGKLLYAYDRATGASIRPSTEYFLCALATVRANKERYAAAEALASQHRPNTPPWFRMARMMSTAVRKQ
ncbi:MAG: AAA family ATPase [Capsulimonadaceae bacterium]